MITLSRNEILVLECLLKSGCVSEIKAITLKKLGEKVNLSYYSVRNILKALVYADFCGEGCKCGRADTFYVNARGIEVLNKLKEDVL